MKIDTAQDTFVGGEFAPALFGRTDIAQYENACQTLENVLIRPYGAVVSCPGTEYVNDSKNSTSSSSGITNYWPASGIINGYVTNYANGYNNGSDEDQSWQVCCNCTITKMVVKLAVSPGTGKRREFTLRKNGVDTDLTVSITDTSTGGTISGSVSFSTPVSSFDKISIKEKLIENATDSAFSVGLLATTSDDHQVIVSGRRWGTFWNDAFYSPFFNNNATRWDPGSAGGVFTTNHSRSGFQSYFSSAGVLKNLRWEVDEPPAPTSSTNQYLLGTDNSIPQYLISLSTTSFGQYTSSNIVSKSTGQYESFFRNVNNFDPLTRSDGWHTIDFYPSNAGDRIFNCDVRPVSSGTNTFHSAIGMSELGEGGRVTTDLPYEPFSIIPTDGTVKNLFIDCFNTPTPAKPLIVTMRKNGADTSLAVTINNGSTTGNNTTNTIAVTTGDYLSLKMYTDDNVNWGSQVKPKIAWTFTSSTPTETPIILTSLGYAASTNAYITVPETRTYNKSRLIPFVFSKDDSYIIETGPSYFRFYTDGAVVTA